MKKVNICYIFNNKNEVLLQHKSRGFGKGKWNGPGGKAELGETIEESVHREVFEETGLILNKIKQIAYFEYIFEEKQDWNMEAYAFSCYDYSGKPEDRGEGELKWFKVNDVPLDKMWEDDKIWFKKTLSGGPFAKMRFYFNKEGKLLKYHNL